MDLSTLLSQFYGHHNVQSTGCIHHIYPTNNSGGVPRHQASLSEVISSLQGWAENHQLQLDQLEANGANVYDQQHNFVGTIIIHYW